MLVCGESHKIHATIVIMCHVHEETNFANYLPMKLNQSSLTLSLALLTDEFNYQNLLTE